MQQNLRGAPLPPAQARAGIAAEVANAAAADVILAREAETAAEFVAAGHADVRVLGYAVAPPISSAPFRRRRGFLFAGPTVYDDTPNTDAVVWFVDHVLPILRRRLGNTLALTTVGRNLSPLVSARCADGRITSMGVVSDLAAAFAGARVFVAPSRDAVAAPLKVYDAAAHGLPAVVTPILARRLGWRHGREVLVARSADAFAAACLEAHGDQVLWEGLRADALARVAADCDPRRFDAIVRDLVTQAASRQG
jgi:glycosyltransferase involved in cell wall biosynthesis